MITFPIIDLKEKNCEQRFLASLRDTGFAVLKNHPLDLDLVKSIYGHWKVFFRATKHIFTPTIRKNRTGISRSPMQSQLRGR